MKFIWILALLGVVIAGSRAAESPPPKPATAPAPVVGISLDWGKTVPAKVVSRNGRYLERLKAVIEENLRVHALLANERAPGDAGTRLSVTLTKFSPKGAAIGIGKLGAPEIAGSVEVLDAERRPLRTLELSAQQFLGLPNVSADGSPEEWLAQQFAKKLALALAGTAAADTPAAAGAAPADGAGKSRLVVFRRSNFLGVGAGPKLSVDGREVGSLNVGRVLEITVSAGKHTVSTEWSGFSAAMGYHSLTAEIEGRDGETLYLEYSFREGKRTTGLFSSKQEYIQELLPLETEAGSVAVAKLRKK